MFFITCVEFYYKIKVHCSSLLRTCNGLNIFFLPKYILRMYIKFACWTFSAARYSLNLRKLRTCTDITYTGSIAGLESHRIAWNTQLCKTSLSPEKPSKRALTRVSSAEHCRQVISIASMIELLIMPRRKHLRKINFSNAIKNVIWDFLWDRYLFSTFLIRYETKFPALIIKYLN